MDEGMSALSTRDGEEDPRSTLSHTRTGLRGQLLPLLRLRILRQGTGVSPVHGTTSEAKPSQLIMACLASQAYSRTTVPADKRDSDAPTCGPMPATLSV